jgi:hypothetical protein
MAFFALTLLLFAAAFERGSAPGVAASGVLWGLALATKANALFLPAIVLLLVAVAARPRRWQGSRRRVVGLGGRLPGGGTGHRLRSVALPVGGAGRARDRASALRRAAHLLDAPRERISPLAAIAYTTTAPFLGLAIAASRIAAREIARGGREPASCCRWPGSRRARAPPPARRVNFDGVRHFLELFPARDPRGRRGLALAAAAAGGPRQRSRSGAPPRPERRCLLAPADRRWRVHPFELAYWNALAGGLGGARAKKLAQAGDYWATSYRTGLEWLNAEAPPGAGTRRAAGAARGATGGADPAAP